MKKIGRKEIKEAIDNLSFTKEEYQGWEIDEMILDYHKIPTIYSLEESTEESNEFEDISVVYTYIDELMEQKGYISDDLCIYKRKVINNVY